VTRVSPTAEFASLVYGPRGVDDDDPAEAFHESSRLYPHVTPDRLGTLVDLTLAADLQQTVARAGRTHEHRPGLDLDRGRLPHVPLADALSARRSRPPDVLAELELGDLGAVLEAGYAAHAGRRPVPSGGALYPLELYVLALAVAGASPAVFHYDPFRHRLAFLERLDRELVASTLVDAALAEPAAAMLVVTAMFWRTRFKYGRRGYRFALLEAGHVVQNVLLAAAGLQLPALPIGGFYDRRLDMVVGADGLDEASLYAVVLGGRA